VGKQSGIRLISVESWRYSLYSKLCVKNLCRSFGVYRRPDLRVVSNLPPPALYCIKVFGHAGEIVSTDMEATHLDRRLDRNLQSDWLVWRSEFQFENFIFLCGVRRYGDELLIRSGCT
jgi:hypothetical protein